MHFCRHHRIGFPVNQSWLYFVSKDSSSELEWSYTRGIHPDTTHLKVFFYKIFLFNEKVRVKEISGPFNMKHNRSAVPGGYYTRLPILFNPTTNGSHSGTVVLEVGHDGQSLSIALRGDAFI